jgi:hypothetical protein
MRVAAAIALVLAGCASEADVLLEVTRPSSNTTLEVQICDETHPADCAITGETAPIEEDRTVHEIAIYLDRTIAPPLHVLLQQTAPSSCNVLVIDPALQSGTIVLSLAEEDGDTLTIDMARCPECAQEKAPLCP